jgi:hypothetical protein
MTKQELIEKLQSINFICLNDKDEDDRANRAFYESKPDEMKDLLTRKMGRKGYYSFKTRARYEIFLTTLEYNDFHYVAHQIMIDHLIAFVAIGADVNVEGLVNETLKCAVGKNDEIITELYKIAGIEKKAIA